MRWFNRAHLRNCAGVMRITFQGKSAIRGSYSFLTSKATDLSSGKYSGIACKPVWKEVQSMDISELRRSGKTGFKIHRLSQTQIVPACKRSAEPPVSRSASHLCHARHAERSRRENTVRHSRSHQRELLARHLHSRYG